jgi:hypothetical protein
MKLLTADPGETTGIAINEGAEYSTWQIDCRSLIAIWSFLQAVQPDVIVYEDFKHRPNLMKAELYSMQVIGVLRLYAEMNHVPIPAKYLPSEAQAFWNDAKIKKIGMWRPAHRHGMDALSVMLTHKMKTDNAWFRDMLPKLK